MTDSQYQVPIGIIGGGPAGMSCALWLKQLGLKPVIIEKNDRLGGQLLQIDRINRWVLGFVDKTSSEIGHAFAKHIEMEAIDVRTGRTLHSASPLKSGFELTIDSVDAHEKLQVRSLVIAAGTRVLGSELFSEVTGFDPIYRQRMISFFPLDHLHACGRLKDKRVAVIGGGDNAYFTALDLAKAGTQVYVLSRSHPKARRRVQEETKTFVENGMITVIANVRVGRFEQRGKSLTITLLSQDSKIELNEIRHVYVRAGFAANSAFLETFEAFSGLEKTGGYIKTDVNRRTSVPWVYAIGDIANPSRQSLVGAVADGALAAQDLSDRI